MHPFWCFSFEGKKEVIINRSRIFEQRVRNKYDFKEEKFKFGCFKFRTGQLCEKQKANGKGRDPPNDSENDSKKRLTVIDEESRDHSCDVYVSESSSASTLGDQIMIPSNYDSTTYKSSMHRLTLNRLKGKQISALKSNFSFHSKKGSSLFEKNKTIVV